MNGIETLLTIWMAYIFVAGLSYLMGHPMFPFV